jgi:hypothetical protein
VLHSVTACVGVTFLLESSVPNSANKFRASRERRIIPIDEDGAMHAAATDLDTQYRST